MSRRQTHSLPSTATSTHRSKVKGKKRNKKSKQIPVLWTATKTAASLRPFRAQIRVPGRGPWLLHVCGSWRLWHVPPIRSFARTHYRWDGDVHFTEPECDPHANSRGAHVVLLLFLSFCWDPPEYDADIIQVSGVSGSFSRAVFIDRNPNVCLFLPAPWYPTVWVLKTAYSAQFCSF